MRQQVTWMLAAVGLATAVGAAPAAAQEPQAVLYEVTENMYLKGDLGQAVSSLVGAVTREADAQLQGWAKVGTPLCPSALLVTNPRLQRCTVTVRGLDNISLKTGLGKVHGTYAVVMQGDNSVDAAEFVVQTGKFQGDMDFRRSMSGQAPIGYISNGLVSSDANPARKFRFAGTFRLPFTQDDVGQRFKPRRWMPAFYLGDDGQPFFVTPDERSLGEPTVRLELVFP